MGSIHPSEAQLAELMEGDDSGPVTMINLLRYRDDAEYPAGSEATACSGREAYQRYGGQVTPLIEKAGAHVVWAGSVVAAAIAPDGEAWHDAILVQYPTRAAFIEMVSAPVYQAAAVHRTAALLDSRLIATRGAVVES